MGSEEHERQWREYLAGMHEAFDKLIQQGYSVLRTQNLELPVKVQRTLNINFYRRSDVGLEATLVLFAFAPTAGLNNGRICQLQIMDRLGGELLFNWEAPIMPKFCSKSINQLDKNPDAKEMYEAILKAFNF